MVPGSSLLALCLFALNLFLQDVVGASVYLEDRLVVPKVVIISMWTPEGEVWHVRLPDYGLGNLTSVKITIGEGEINASASMMALVLSRKFDFRQTYFIFAGMAGVNPKHGTLGSVALAQYAVQVGLQYEIDSRDLPPQWPTGYIPYGRGEPFQYPLISYGTEVFELNANLRDVAYDLAKDTNMADSFGAREYRAKYTQMSDVYPMAVQPPSIIRCDCATSDVYFSGVRLAEAFENTTQVWTNGSATYCMSAQEENATLEVMVRAAIEGLVDFARVIVMRAASNFDRAPPDTPDWEHLTKVDQNAYFISLDNLFNVGIPIIKGIVKDWNCTFGPGITPSNYVGDIFGSLGGEPDFGYGSITGGERVLPNGGSGEMLALRGPTSRRRIKSRWL